MAYVLIVISFVAMGGPKDTTPTIDHIPFQTEAACKKAAEFIAHTVNRHVTWRCLPTG